MSTLIGLTADWGVYSLRGEIEAVAKQEDVSTFELPTDGYTFLNLYATWRPLGEDSNIAINLAALNVADEEGRQHTSYLKDMLPLPGQNFKISMTGRF